MTLNELIEYCMEKEGAYKDFPFDGYTLTMKVGRKMFLLTSINSEKLSFNVKCNPELAIMLRQNYKAVKPGYHMNKTHWNTIEAGEDMSDEEMLKMVDHSYEIVFKSLTKAEKNKIKDEL